MSEVHGIPCFYIHQDGDQPDSLQANHAVDLKRLILEGVSHQAIKEIQEQGLWVESKSTRTTYLLHNNSKDVFWALEFLRENPQNLRELLRSEAAAGTLIRYKHSGSLADLRGMDSDELMVLLRKLLAYSADRDGDVHQRWYSLLTNSPCLPFASKEQIFHKLDLLSEQGVLEKEGGRWYPASNDDRWLLSFQEEQVLVDRSRHAVLHIKTSHAEEHLFQDFQQMNRWLEDAVDSFRKNRYIKTAIQVRAHPAVDSIAVPDLGGLGDLHQWEALISSGAEALEAEEIETVAEQALASHPASDWMPGMHAALVSSQPEKDDGETPSQLVHSVQLHNLGSIVHLGSPVQKSRLGREAVPLRLFHPVNPFSSAPQPMSARPPTED